MGFFLTYHLPVIHLCFYTVAESFLFSDCQDTKSVSVEIVIFYQSSLVFVGFNNLKSVSALRAL